ncbi:hypothetical protein EDB86DRAFT_3086381 [Lactarius hatsudake]|nr:hypothetical protein EDB86DRAFT_3086381 [Lactarius hatsudake]
MQFYLVTLLISFAVVSPYMSISKWKDNFRPPKRHRVINPRAVIRLGFRFSAFQVVGAWANTGISLVDQNLVPFQAAYPLLVFMLLVLRDLWPILYTFNVGFFNALLFTLEPTDRYPCLEVVYPQVSMEAVKIERDPPLFTRSPTTLLHLPLPLTTDLVSSHDSNHPEELDASGRSLGIFDDEDDIDIEDEEDYPVTDLHVKVWGRYLGRHTRRQLSFGERPPIVVFDVAAKDLGSGVRPLW